jgi:hypothetical protein
MNERLGELEHLATLRALQLTATTRGETDKWFGYAQRRRVEMEPISTSEEKMLDEMAAAKVDEYGADKTDETVVERCGVEHLGRMLDFVSGIELSDGNEVRAIELVERTAANGKRTLHIRLLAI